MTAPANITEQLAQFVADLSSEEIPAEVTNRAAMLTLDLWGNMVRARNDAASTECVLAAATDLGLGHGPCLVVGGGETVSPAGAAFLNGTFAHTLDFDDTHALGSLHPSAPVIPAALAAAQMTRCNGRTLLTGIIAGYEVGCRLSQALVPSDHYDRGFHPTATAGIFAAAAAAAKIFDFDRAKVSAAFGAALSHAAGTMQFLENGSWNKRTQIGGAAMNGLLAACLARRGFIGAAKAIEGQYGFLKAYAPKSVPERAIAGLGREWETLRIGVKPYPSCRMTHAPIDILLDQVRNHQLKAEAVQEVRIGLSNKGIDLVGAPQDRKRRPRHVVDGQFSMHFSAAVVLLEGRFGWDDYANHIGNSITEALADRIIVEHDAEVEDAYPAHLSGSVSIRTAQGNIRHFARDPRGEPDLFPTEAEFTEKFTALAERYLGVQRTAQVARTILGLWDVDDLTKLLVDSRPSPPFLFGAAE